LKHLAFQRLRAHEHRLRRSMSPVISGKLKQPSTPTSVSPRTRFPG
jgi:hypothetical protein